MKLLNFRNSDDLLLQKTSFLALRIVNWKSCAMTVADCESALYFDGALFQSQRSLATSLVSAINPKKASSIGLSI